MSGPMPSRFLNDGRKPDGPGSDRRALRIAFVTAYAASDPAGWSGVALHMSRALEAQGIFLEYIGDLRERRPVLATAKQRLCRLAGRRYMRDRDPAIVRGYARQVAAALSTASVDAVLSPGTIPVAYLDGAAPIVFWTDAAFSGLVGFYPEYTNLCGETVRGGNAAERAAIDRCSLAIYTSDWAAQSAIRGYGADPDKVRVVPFGANLSAWPRESEVSAGIRARRDGECRLVFLGRDWERKGGPMAVAVTEALNRNGVRARLAIVGCAPRLDAASRPFCEVIGPLDTASPAGHARLADTLSKSHFLILPTRADCTPHAVGEANAFGVPCLAAAVGGLPTLVREGHNGALFSPAAAPDEWCGFVARSMASRAGYESLAFSSYAEFCGRLNWRTATAHVTSLIEGVLG